MYGTVPRRVMVPIDSTGHTCGQLTEANLSGFITRYGASLFRGTAHTNFSTSSRILLRRRSYAHSPRIAVRRWPRSRGLLTSEDTSCGRSAAWPVLRPQGFERPFHDYFIRHVPSSAIHAESHPGTTSPEGFPSAAAELNHSSFNAPVMRASHGAGDGSRDMTVVRIPLHSARMHFGVSSARGTRLYNEDAHQAGVIEVPAFAQRPSRRSATASPSQGVESAGNDSSDPQCFYFGVFDGHGGSECSRFLRNNLHLYIEDAAKQLELLSSLKRKDIATSDSAAHNPSPTTEAKSALQGVHSQQLEGELSSASEAALNKRELKAQVLQQKMVSSWADLVGGYFKRFSPEHFHLMRDRRDKPSGGDLDSISFEVVLTYAFLKADFDFVAEQTERLDQDIVRSDRALNEHDILGEASRLAPGSLGARQVLGGSTCSIALISTPTAVPFWLPATCATLVTAHVGDTRILLCSTATGHAMPLTTNHHPSASGEGLRLRRYAANVVCDSFGEERMDGLANTRAFGDVQSKPLGVSAEPEIRRLELRPAEYSFLVLVSDGVSGLLADQEIVDVIKESSTPEEGARDLVNFATEVSQEGDNATCMVVRLGGWERRMEGGHGAQGTKEARDRRRQEAIDSRHRRQ